jgi:hypothetical protein
MEERSLSGLLQALANTADGSLRLARRVKKREIPYSNGFTNQVFFSTSTILTTRLINSNLDGAVKNLNVCHSREGGNL